ncbi:MAG: 30S ribosomal protein S20 [bacterium]
MPHHKAPKKSLRQDAKRRARNMAGKSRMKNAIKKVLKAVEARDVSGAKESLTAASIIIDKSCSKGFIHKNTAARKKSRLSARVNALSV